MKRGPDSPLFGENHSSWKGEHAPRRTIHRWLVSHYPKTGVCESCGETPAPRTDRLGRLHEATHYAFKRHGEPYSRDRDDYVEVCRPCHTEMDMPYIRETARRNALAQWRRRRAAESAA